MYIRIKCAIYIEAILMGPRNGKIQTRVCRVVIYHFTSELPCFGMPYSYLTIISDAMIIWRRMQNNSRSFFLSFNDLEERLLANPKDVFYGSVLSVKLTFKTVPCNITTVSPSYLRVKPMWCSFFFCQKLSKHELKLISLQKPNWFMQFW